MPFSFRWNEESMMVLLELCAKFRATNIRCQQFKWKDILVNFEKRVGKEVSMKVLKNKMAVMKKDYNLWMHLKGTETGLRFNPFSGQILADPNWWENKIKENCDFKKFRYKGISPAIEYLCACIFEDSYATNEIHVSPGLVRAAAQNTPAVNVLDQHSATNVDNVASEDEQFRDDLDTTDQSIKRQRSSDSMEERCVELLIAMRVSIERMLAMILKLYNRVEDALAVLYRMLDAGLLQRCGTLFCFGVSELLNDETGRRFMNMEDDSQRKAWLESEYAHRHKGLL